MNDDLENTDDRGSLAKAIDKASEVLTACLMMALPGVGGYFVDQYFKTGWIFTILAFVFGLIAGTVQLTKIVQKNSATGHFTPGSSDSNRRDDDSK